MQVDTFTREKYRDQRGRDYAGPISKLEESTVTRWKELYPDWLGKHWAMVPTQRGGPTLTPINVRN